MSGSVTLGTATAPARLRYCVGLSMRPPPYWNAPFYNWQYGQQ